jgi:hypothetical protein
MAQARQLLQRHRVTYLLVGERERVLGPRDPGQDLGFPVVHRVGSATVYRVFFW